MALRSAQKSHISSDTRTRCYSSPGLTRRPNVELLTDGGRSTVEVAKSTTTQVSLDTSWELTNHSINERAIGPWPTQPSLTLRAIEHACLSPPTRSFERRCCEEHGSTRQDSYYSSQRSQAHRRNVFDPFPPPWTNRSCLTSTAEVGREQSQLDDPGDQGWTCDARPRRSTHSCHAPLQYNPPLACHAPYFIMSSSSSRVESGRRGRMEPPCLGAGQDIRM